MTNKFENRTKPSSFWVPMALAAVSTFAWLFVAGVAQAGVVTPVTQLHAFKVGGTIFAQGIDDRTGDDVLEKDKFKEKDLGANCLMQEKLDRGQSIVLVLNDACGDINDNEIQIVTEAPPSALAVGEVDFDVDLAIVNQRRGVDESLTIPATVELVCLGTVDVDVEASAVATIKFGRDSGCFESMKLQNGSGTGTIDGIDVILDGIKADAKKPSRR